MTIAPAAPGQLDELVRLARHLFDITFSPTNDPVVMEEYMREAFTPVRIREEYDEPGSLFLVAWEGASMVGYARLRRNAEADHLLGPSNIELQRFYLDPSVQGKGLAVQLFNECLKYCTGLDWMWLGVWEHNPKAIRFYEKCGFEKFGEHVFAMGFEDQTDWLMRKRLKHQD